MPEISPSIGAHWHRANREKRCVSCSASKPLGEFYAYAYTTNQGMRSTRYESRCKPCARARRLIQYAANREAELVRMATWHQENADHQKQYQSQYRASENGRRRKACSQRMRAARARLTVDADADPEEIRAIYEEAFLIEALAAVCPVFDDPLLTKRMHVDHVIPLSKGGKHVASNLQILPAGINMRKGNKCPR